MALNKIAAYAAHGANIRDKLVLALSGLIAPADGFSHKRLRRLIARATPCLWLKPTRLKGQRVLIDPSDWSQTIIFEEIFVHSGYDLTKVKFVPEVVLDCGAHIGLFSVLARSVFPHSRQKAYEPNPKNIEFIRRQIAANHLDIELIESAVSTEQKELFFTATNSHSGRLLNTGSGNESYKVQVISFPEALKQIGSRSLLLKMDIEGEERRVLPVIMPLLPPQSALFFETHAGEEGWREIESLLTANGFCVEQITVRGQFYDGFASRG